MPPTPLVSALALAAAAVLPGPVGGGVGPAEDRAGGLPRLKVVDGGIPSLVYLPPAAGSAHVNGTLLAVGQAGHSGPDRLLLHRSDTLGASWEPVTNPAPGGLAPPFKAAQNLEQPQLGYDSKSGKAFLFFTVVVPTPHGGALPDSRSPPPLDVTMGVGQAAATRAFSTSWASGRWSPPTAAAAGPPPPTSRQPSRTSYTSTTAAASPPQTAWASSCGRAGRRRVGWCSPGRRTATTAAWRSSQTMAAQPGTGCAPIWSWASLLCSLSRGCAADG